MEKDEPEVEEHVESRIEWMSRACETVGGRGFAGVGEEKRLREKRSYARNRYCRARLAGAVLIESYTSGDAVFEECSKSSFKQNVYTRKDCRERP